MLEIEKIIQLAEQEIGYLEKDSNNNLDSKTENAGSKNFTKYARDLDNIEGFYNGKKNGYAWCDVFVDWLFVTAFGIERAKEMLCYGGQLGAGCGFSLNYYKQKGQFFTVPKKGDQIFFRQGNSITHTGLVIDVTSENVYTIEGNTNPNKGVVANGGQVAKKKYGLGSGFIAGYGRPFYGNVETVDNNVDNNKYTYKEFVKDVQKSIGASVDGIAGPETLSKTVTISKTKNNRHLAVRPIQEYLKLLGYNEVGDIDGIAGNKFDMAAKHFQKDNNCLPDGEFTSRNKTWKKILKIG